MTADDIVGYKDILLTEDDPNEGHITIVAHDGGWAIAFDFRRNATRIAEHSEVARQFLETARWARRQDYARVVVDNLFSATELMAKGMLIGSPTDRCSTRRPTATSRCASTKSGGTTTSTGASSTSSTSSASFASLLATSPETLSSPRVRWT